jgi:hypothetical protein
MEGGSNSDGKESEQFELNEDDMPAVTKKYLHLEENSLEDEETIEKVQKSEDIEELGS